MKISTFSNSKKAEIPKILNPSQLKTHQPILHFLPGFDTITYGFCLQQCITETVLGALVGVSAVISTFFLLKNTNFFGEIYQFVLVKSQYANMDSVHLTIFDRDFTFWSQKLLFLYFIYFPYSNWNLFSLFYLDFCFDIYF